MARVTAIYFDEDQDVKEVRMVVSRDEAEFISGATVPEVIAEPISIGLNAKQASAVFHRAGKVPGTHEDYAVSSEVYYALMAVVDRLIEHE